MKSSIALATAVILGPAARLSAAPLSVGGLPSAAYADTEVSTNVVHCCPCPEHWTTNVSLASKSYNLSVRDLSGQKFVSTNANCGVHVYGLAPSRDFNDSTLSFCKTGTVFGVHKYTVLGVGIHHADCDLAAVNQANRNFGYPIVICTNAAYGTDFILRTDVDLPGGNIALGTSSTNCGIKVWHRNWRESRHDLLLDAMESTNRVFSIEQWRRMIADDSGDHALVVSVTAGSRGSVDLTLSYAVGHDGMRYSDSATQRLTAIRPPLITDYNHNGRIDESDYRRYGEGLPFRFWPNEDDVSLDSRLPRPNSWPRRSSYPNQWLHSDMKDMSYFYNHKFYEKVKEKGGLQ